MVADAGSAANVTLKLLNDLPWPYVFALLHTRKFTNGPYGRDLVQPLPPARYRRRATAKPDGHRHDYWVFIRHAELHQLGDVTIKELKSGLHVGCMQVTHDVDRVTRSVVFPGCAYLVLLHLYSGKDGVKAELRACEFWTADERLVNRVKATLSFVKWLGDYVPRGTP